MCWNQNVSLAIRLVLFGWMTWEQGFGSGRIFAVDAEAPLPAEVAAQSMTVPPGFQVTLFAGEPAVKQPISFCIDDRGRLWVAEAYNYPNHGNTPGDRILILEDVDGDGRFDKRTVFYDQLNYVTGVEVGFGGVWVMSPPNFYFIPDRDGDDQPDGPPQLLLDGFGNHANSHNLANALAWGPDGWLYGTHGRTNWSTIGKPGTAQGKRFVFDGGVYRYHPVDHVWEPFADGMTNPWGIDWDDYGQGFACNCVTPHLFHVIQGAHYEPWRNRKSSQYAYERIATIADHLHFVGTQNVRDGLGSDAEDHAGGGHAHCGTMVYLGDNWPEQYRNQVFMHNIHGKRINQDLLRHSGSGYVASHGPDLMRSQDPWFMGVTLQYGPDGAVYSSDWSDTGECHSVKNPRRETGRIFKISYGKPAATQVDLAKLDDQALVQLHLHRNDWQVRHARRLLQERAAAGSDMVSVGQELRNLFEQQPQIPRKLRALWTMHAIKTLDSAYLSQQLGHESEHIRAWAIQLLCEDSQALAPTHIERLNQLAQADPSPRVRLALASALQRLSLEQRWEIGAALAARGEDQADANLPLMIWYGIEPLLNLDVQRFVELSEVTRIPLVRRHIARRVAESGSAQGLEALVAVVRRSAAEQVQLDVLQGMLQGFAGRRTVTMPTNWTDTYSQLKRHELVKPIALQLALVFDDPIALETLREDAGNPKLAAVDRNRAITALVGKQAKNIVPLLHRLIEDPATRNQALRGLAEYDDPSTGEAILNLYDKLDATARQDALQTLASRKIWASKLLDAVSDGEVPRQELTAFTARQMQSLGSEDITQRVTELWGDIRATSADKGALIAKFKKLLTEERLQKADLSAGRVIFQSTCANCHRLFGSGGQVGPEITGSQRSNIDYLLENILDPNATVAKDFRLQVVETASGRIVSGLIIAENERALTIQTANEQVIVPLDEIETRTTSPLSVMPDGLLQTLSQTQIVDLFAYLRSPHQVPLPNASNTDDSLVPSKPEH